MIQPNLARSKRTGRFCTNTNLMAFLSINRNQSTCVLSVGGFVHVEHVSERNQGACSTWRQHGRIRGFNARVYMFVSADSNKKKSPSWGLNTRNTFTEIKQLSWSLIQWSDGCFSVLYFLLIRLRMDAIGLKRRPVLQWNRLKGYFIHVWNTLLTTAWRHEGLKGQLTPRLGASGHAHSSGSSISTETAIKK